MLWLIPAAFAFYCLAKAKDEITVQNEDPDYVENHKKRHKESTAKMTQVMDDVTFKGVSVAMNQTLSSKETYEKLELDRENKADNLVNDGVREVGKAILK